VHPVDDTAVVKAESLVIALKNKLSTDSRTAKLWVQYLDHVNVVERFILAERTGNWFLHLSTVSSMLGLQQSDIITMLSQLACTCS